MGNIHSSNYHSLDGKPVVAPVVKIWSEGEEWVRFVDTIWTQILQVDTTSHEKHKHTFKKAKAIVVQGQTSGEIHYLSRDALVSALGGDLRQVSRFVNRKKNYEIHVKWFMGYVTDPKTCRLRESCYLDPVPDPTTGKILRKIDTCDAYLSEFKDKDGIKAVDDAKLEDVRVDYKAFSDDIYGWIKHTPVLLSKK